jgi:hypothetical protein
MATQIATGVHLDLDGAWADLDLPRTDLRLWGPRLRFAAPERLIEEFYRQIAKGLGDFTLYGSGDFHHLSALWLRRLHKPLTLVSFDNHPDWDLRPPRWACGGWINRALELKHVRKAAVWGCGNFELKPPNRWFGNRRGVREGRLELFAWTERCGKGDWNPISRTDWKDRFSDFAAKLGGEDIYVTVDMDCMEHGEAVTQWEQGLFTAEDVAWAIRTLRNGARVVGGDLCGAWSPPAFDRWTQKCASGFDHPRIPPVNEAEARRTNLKALKIIWPALTSSCV